MNRMFQLLASLLALLCFLNGPAMEGNAEIRHSTLAGMFISYDSGWNDLDPSSVSFSAGDPVNYFDSAGRIGKNGNAALSGDYLVLDQNFRPVGSYSAYDVYYLGGQARAMRFSLRHNPLLGAGMGVDAPVNAFGGRSFRMVFGNEAAGFADFALNMDTAPLGMLNEVALSSESAGTASVTGRNRGFAYTRATVAVLSAGMMLEEPVGSFRTERLPVSEPEFGVSFFDKKIADAILADPRLGRAGQQHFFMPVEDATAVRNASDASRLSGRAPGVDRAYLNGEPVYGLVFPTQGMTVRRPTALDADGWPHYLEGGRTAVRTSDAPTGAYLLNSTKEYVVPGGISMPKGTILFQVGPNGEWIILKQW